VPADRPRRLARRQARRHRRPTGPSRGHVDVRGAEPRGQPAGERVPRPRGAARRQGRLGRAQLARRRPGGPRAAEDRGDRGAAELPAGAGRGGVHRRQLGRRAALRGCRVRGAARADPRPGAGPPPRGGLRRPGAGGHARRRRAAGRGERRRARGRGRRGPPDEHALHVGHNGPAQGGGAAGDAARGGAPDARADGSPARRRLRHHRAAVPLGAARLPRSRPSPRQHRRAPAQVRRRGLAAPGRPVSRQHDVLGPHPRSGSSARWPRRSRRATTARACGA